VPAIVHLDTSHHEDPHTVSIDGIGPLWKPGDNRALGRAPLAGHAAVEEASFPSVPTTERAATPQNSSMPDRFFACLRLGCPWRPFLLFDDNDACVLLQSQPCECLKATMHHDSITPT
jgi:hypothetical protein